MITVTLVDDGTVLLMRRMHLITVVKVASQQYTGSLTNAIYRLIILQ